MTWRDSASEFVTAAVFDKKQFITDEEIGIGGSVQNWCVSTSILVLRKGPEVSGRTREVRKW